MPKPQIHLFLDADNYPAKLLVAGVDPGDMEAHQLVLDGVTGFMDGDAKTMVVADNFKVMVHERA
jgi:hypothetical protein